MNVFFAPDIAVGSLAFLDETESHHAVQVMRMKEGNSIYLFDGKGNLFEAVVAEAGKKQLTASVLSLKANQPQQNFLHIAIAPTKQTERFEWFLEKAVELGVAEVSPIICQRSERRELKTERLQKLIVAACKQSKNYHLPTLHEPCSFHEFLKKGLPENRCIACCEAQQTSLKAALEVSPKTIVMIGPEGDFSQTEIDACIAKGFQTVSLGNSILRSETAGVFVAAAYRFLGL